MGGLVETMHSNMQALAKNFRHGDYMEARITINHLQKPNDSGDMGLYGMVWISIIVC